ncbi:MAG: tRNA threonylcarbamoyladenosine dehydratase [Bacteroides sp.]|nr:tRNA threonylcarbamoyladenosine dehydratase [Bacteroides sp.]
MTDSTSSERLSRVTRLLGSAATEALQNARVIIFGIGGVGSWTAECLARSGVGTLTIVDADVVAESNINRQLVATVSAIGRPKTEVLAERLLDINPDLNLTCRPERYTAETASTFRLEDYDIVVDAIDSLADKASLIVHATSLPGVTLISSMGAALKSDPTRIAVAEFWKVKGCPLAAALRRRFKKSGIMPRRKFKCVYSDELLPNRGDNTGSRGTMTFGKVAVNGALCHITAIFGFTLAGLAVEKLIQEHR